MYPVCAACERERESLQDFCPCGHRFAVGEDEDAANLRPLFVKWLVLSGAEPYAKSVSGNTPFHVAVTSGHMPVIESMYEHGCAAISVKGFCGDTPLHMVAADGNEEVCTWLLEHRADQVRTPRPGPFGARELGVAPITPRMPRWLW